MAESAVIAIVRPVIDKLVSLLYEEASLLKHVHREIKSIADELETIHCFLKEADEKGEMSEGVKTWVRQVREEAYRIEDVTDEYVLRVAHNRHDQRPGYVGFFSKMGRLVKALRPRYDIASEIQDIKACLREIKERGERFGFNSLEKKLRAEGSDPRLGALFVEESELIGVGSIRDELTRRLVEGPSSRCITILVGTCGIGKTTLARKVYKDEEVKGYFSCRAWINVSQSYNMEKLLRIMAKQFFPSSASALDAFETIEELIESLRQYLQNKRYVIVFDDVWQIDFWEIMKHALPSNDLGSRIIVTTRNNSIASSCKKNSCDLIQNLEPWSFENSKELFCKKAFQSEPQGQCPKELEQLCNKIVNRCERLPLIISAVAGLLSTKNKLVSEWQKLSNNLSSEFGTNPHLSHCIKILSLSYQDLPYQLKPCFLYFGVYPKNHPVRTNKLYGKWITEGFVKETRNKTVEQVAEEFLTELIDRNLVQSWEVGRYGVRRCQVHDLMHETILLKATELGFCQILDENSPSFIGKTRRLSICNNNNENLFETISYSGVRSVLFYNVNRLATSVLVTMFERFKLLKVLDFAHVHLDYLPEELGNLFHLNYLSLHNTKLKMLPKSICRLCNLRILDIRATLIHKLPREINKLRHLRHLLANSRSKNIDDIVDEVRGVRICEGISNLLELQTLITIEANPNRLGIIEELVKLKQLRSLAISNLTAEVGKVVCATIEKMNHLESLSLYSINNDEILDLQSANLTPRLLQNLNVKSRMKYLPNWIAGLDNLRVLSLCLSRLTDDPLKTLHSLSNLEYLLLYNAYEGQELHFQRSGFPKLKRLVLRELEGLEVMKIDEGSLPLLENLEIGPSPQLKKLPSGIEHLRNLTSLRFYDMPKQFVVALLPNGGRDYDKVKNIPYVHFNYQVEGKHYQIYKLGDADFLNNL